MKLEAILATFVLAAWARPASADCDADCKFIKKLVAGEPKRFRALHDRDGIVTVKAPLGEYCSYQYRPEAKRAEIFCLLTRKTTEEEINDKWPAAVKSLTDALGAGWKPGEPDDAPMRKKLSTVHEATDARAELSAILLGDSSWIAIKIGSRTFP
jgi:hypothetical protein